MASAFQVLFYLTSTRFCAVSVALPVICAFILATLFAEQPSVRPDEVQPGPGEYALASHYEVCSTATAEPSFSIPGNRGIGPSEWLSHLKLPATAAAKMALTFAAMPVCVHKLSCQHGEHAGQRTPGPADYKSDSRAVLPGNPAYTIAGRHDGGSQHSTPGPGAYAVANNSRLVGSHPNAPGYFIPTSSRRTDNGDSMPGPGGELGLAGQW